VLRFRDVVLGFRGFKHVVLHVVLRFRDVVLRSTYFCAKKALISSVAGLRFRDVVLRFRDVVLRFRGVVLRFRDVVLRFRDVVLGFRGVVLRFKHVVLRFRDVVLRSTYFCAKKALISSVAGLRFRDVVLTLLRGYLVYHFGVFARAAAAASRPVACWGCYLGGLPTPWIVCRPQKTACGAFEWCNRGVQKCDIGDIEIPDVPGHLGS
jgi:hypothetical protein